MTHETTVVLVGIGGYGELYLSALLDEPQGSRCRIVGAVDPQPTSSSRLGDLASLGVPIHATLDEFYADHDADLAVISSPIQLHAEQTCGALAHGSHVLVEKPAAAVNADIDRMIEARDRAKRLVAVGFQWSFSRSILQLKRDIMAGRFGMPRCGRCLTLWPRTASYYRRNDWAGKKRDAQGRWILDSPANNAMAHSLHNLLFLLGDLPDSSASPVSVTARLARVNEIDTFDTICARVSIKNGVDLLFLASHAIAESETIEPRFKLEFQHAVVEFSGEDAPITARLDDDTAIEYESPNATPQSEKLWHCVDAIAGGRDILCGLEAASTHTQCIQQIDESGVDVVAFKGNSIRYDETAGGPLRWVPGLASTLEHAYTDGTLPHLKDMK